MIASEKLVIWTKYASDPVVKIEPMGKCLFADHFLRIDWAGCIIVTFGLPDPDQLFLPILIFVCRMCPAPRLKRTFALPKATLKRVRALFHSEAQGESHHFLRGRDFGETQEKSEVCPESERREARTIRKADNPRPVRKLWTNC
jgi:hypothetical protein